MKAARLFSRTGIRIRKLEKTVAYGVVCKCEVIKSSYKTTTKHLCIIGVWLERSFCAAMG